MAAGRRRIDHKRLYDAGEIRALVAKGVDSLVVWTEGAQRDVQALGWDGDQVLELVSLALQRGRALKSEWCVQSPDGPLAACDVYTVYREEYGRADGVKRMMEYYVKFAISRAGNLLLVISCHTTEK